MESGDIPGALRLDGSPPLYYLLLQLWMRAAGTSEEAVRALSVLFGLRVRVDRQAPPGRGHLVTRGGSRAVQVAQAAPPRAG